MDSTDNSSATMSKELTYATNGITVLFSVFSMLLNLLTLIFLLLKEQYNFCNKLLVLLSLFGFLVGASILVLVVVTVKNRCIDVVVMALYWSVLGVILTTVTLSIVQCVVIVKPFVIIRERIVWIVYILSNVIVVALSARVVSCVIQASLLWDGAALVILMLSLLSLLVSTTTSSVYLTRSRKDVNNQVSAERTRKASGTILCIAVVLTVIHVIDVSYVIYKLSRSYEYVNEDYSNPSVQFLVGGVLIMSSFLLASLINPIILISRKEELRSFYKMKLKVNMFDC